MVKGQLLPAAAILAGKAISQKQVEAGEGRKFAGLHILPQSDHAGYLHIQRWRMHLPVIAGDHIHPFKEDRLDRGLPGPQAERIIG